MNSIETASAVTKFYNPLYNEIITAYSSGRESRTYPTMSFTNNRYVPTK